jgi:hypothetical protein
MRARTTLPFLAGILLLAAPTAPAGAEAAPADGAEAARRSDVAQSPNWLAWIGCWRPVGEEAPEGSMVCMLPGETATSVRIATLVDGSITEETVLHADGAPRAVEEGGCRGTETARWSSDGRRVFVRSEFDCGGLARVSTGVLALVAENEWIDVQALTVAEQHASRSVRYRAVRPEATPAVVASQLPQDRRLVQETARMQASMPLDEAAVIEASRAVAPPVVEALLAARQHGFGMSAALLQRLEREQVPSSVIDMMIALSYPGTFALRERPHSAAAAETAGAAGAAGAAWRPARAGVREECYDPFFMQLRYGRACDTVGFGSRYSPYNRYGYGSRFGYSPWGYDPFGWSYGRDPIVVIIEPVQAESRRGEVVKGRGYTNPGTGSTGRSATTRAQPTNSGAGGSTARPASTTSGTSSGQSTGRTAVPRGGQQGGGGGGGQTDPGSP